MTSGSQLHELDDASREHIKRMLCLNEEHHEWDLDEVLQYILYFLPHKTVVRPKDAHQILKSLDIHSADYEIQLKLYKLSTDFRGSNAPFICERGRFTDGTVTETYRFQRQSRQQFEREKLENGRLILAERTPEPEVREISQSLSQLFSKIPDDNERAFAEEAEKCLRVEAYRAAVVMSWLLAYDHLRNWIVNRQLQTFNALLTQKWKNKTQKVKHSAIKTVVDLNEHKERFVIDLCNEAGVLEKPEYRALDHGLNNRNTYAHPSGAQIGPGIAAGHVDDLIRHIVINPKLA